eukprot:TRINITY_DN472_c2_g1_i1.p1 TRINITY_DN472_c2_g1~~TRINITY_DN472_c2_g1_i1.p1  ORF type:complete len:453 (+),score=94.48 TRINITY_DN472_c2_g1_i1:89-1360(+)
MQGEMLPPLRKTPHVRAAAAAAQSAAVQVALAPARLRPPRRRRAPAAAGSPHDGPRRSPAPDRAPPGAGPPARRRLPRRLPAVARSGGEEGPASVVFGGAAHELPALLPAFGCSMHSPTAPPLPDALPMLMPLDSSSGGRPEPSAPPAASPQHAALWPGRRGSGAAEGRRGSSPRGPPPVPADFTAVGRSYWSGASPPPLQGGPQPPPASPTSPLRPLPCTHSPRRQRATPSAGPRSPRVDEEAGAVSAALLQRPVEAVLLLCPRFRRYCEQLSEGARDRLRRSWHPQNAAVLRGTVQRCLALGCFAGLVTSDAGGAAVGGCPVRLQTRPSVPPLGAGPPLPPPPPRAPPQLVAATAVVAAITLLTRASWAVRQRQLAAAAKRRRKSRRRRQSQRRQSRRPRRPAPHARAAADPEWVPWETDA